MSRKMIAIIGVVLIIIIVVYFIFTQTKAMSAEQNTENINLKNSLIVDVRTKEEFAAGHHAQSINIPLADIEHEKIEAFENTEKENIILVCRSGNRSEMVKNILEKNGINKKILNMGAWENLSRIK